jgi:hypothetical protein
VQPNQPGPATHLAIFHIFLSATTSGIQDDLVDLTAIGAVDHGIDGGGPISQRELLIQIVRQIHRAPSMTST